MANVNFLPLLAMVLVQLGYAGMNILSKLAMDSGMSPFVLVTYCQVFATVAITPFALLRERNTRPNITFPILLHIFFCSITGASMDQVFYFLGLKNSMPTIACAISNILSAMTFLFALIFGCILKSIRFKSNAGKAKAIGTLICVGGAMLLSFYHRLDIEIGHSGINWMFAVKMTTQHPIVNSNSLGPFFMIVSTAAWALWFIFQVIIVILLLSLRSLGQKYRIHDLLEDTSALREERESLAGRMSNIKRDLRREASLDSTGFLASRLRLLFGDEE